MAGNPFQLSKEDVDMPPGGQSDAEAGADQAKRPIEPGLEVLLQFVKKSKMAAEDRDQPGSSAMAKAAEVVSLAARSASQPQGTRQKDKAGGHRKSGKTKSGL